MNLGKNFFSRGVKYVAQYPSHYLCYTGFGLTFSALAYHYKNKPNIYLRIGFAGSIAQLLTEIVFHPIDVINTRTKADIVGKVDAFKITRRIWASEGVFGFWHGASSTFYGSLIGGMVYFSTYKWLKNKLKLENTEENKTYNYLAYVCSSLTGELLFMTIYYPFDLVRTRMQTRIHNYKDLLDGFKQIITKKTSTVNNVNYDIKKLYTGATPSFILNMTNQCLIFSIIESMREYFMRINKVTHVKDLGTFDYCMCSIAAGSISGAITNVLEVITIQKQINGSKFKFKEFIREHGYYSLRAGIFARMAINTAHTLALFLIVDEVGVYFGVEL